MRYAFIILKWEIQKILSSWKKTMAVFLIPAAVMVFAINLFPKLLTYLSTGSLGSQRVIVIDAPESFMNYDDPKLGNYQFKYINSEDIPGGFCEESIYSYVNDGNIVAIFITESPEGFDAEVKDYYRHAFQDNEKVRATTYISVVYNEEKFLSETKAEQFSYDIIAEYTETVKNRYFEEYVGEGNENLNIDEYNPITFVLDNRSVANSQAAHIIPGIMVILMYYCSYSLSCDMIAMEKNRGFLNKLIMTPASAKAILWGKAFAANILVTGSSLITFLFLFLSSWLNRSNEAGSLLPFGLMLMPDQLLYMILSIPAATLVMTTFCFIVAMELERFEDAVANMQFVLLLLMFGFFIQMFYYFDPVWLEFIIPVHNMIILLKMILLSQVNIIQFIVVVGTNVFLGVVLLNRCADEITGGKDDRGNKRFKKILFR